jgi:hypothetical protein
MKVIGMLFDRLRGFFNNPTHNHLNLEPFPDLDSYTYSIGIPPAGSRITAWSKLQECERRLLVYKWAEGRNDPRTPKNRVLLNDAVSAFLLTFEATLQFVKDQFIKSVSAPNFDHWIAQLPENDLVVRGLRTLRHFEAHVEAKQPPSLVRLHIGESLSNGTSATQVSRSWQLPPLEAVELAKLNHAPLKANDLQKWNLLVARDDLPSLFRQGLERLRAVLEAAE